MGASALRAPFHPRRRVDKGARSVRIERVAMAVEGDVKELNVHRTGYDRFVGLMKWSALACFAIAMLVIALIAE